MYYCENNKLKLEEAHPIVTVTHKTGIAVKNFHAAETRHYFAKVSCSHTWSRDLRFRRDSCGHESKLPLCVDVEIVITALQAHWCADRWRLKLFRHL